MTSSADARRRRRPPAGALVDVAAVQARLPARAAADGASPSCSSLLAALPDALLALWLKLLGDGVDRRRPRLVRLAALGLGVSAVATWFLRTVSTRVQRRFRDKVTIALESHVATCRRRSRRSPTRSGPSSRPPLGAARPGLRARPHVHVGVLDRRLGPAARRSPSCCWRRSHPALLLLGAVRAAHRAHLDAGGPASSARPRSAAPPSKRLARTCSPPPPPRRPARRCGSRASARGSSSSAATAWEQLVRPGRRGALARRRSGTRLAWAVFGAAYVGAVVFVAVGPRRAGRRRAAGARRRLAAVGLHRRHGRRDRVPARHLDGRLAAAGVARGLRRRHRRRGRPARCPTALERRHPLRATCRSPTRAPTGSCSRTSRSRCRPARSSPSWARTAPARPRS